MPAVIWYDSITGSPGGPQVALCNICAELTAPFVRAVQEGEPRMTALLLLKIHAKLSRLYDARWEGP